MITLVCVSLAINFWAVYYYLFHFERERNFCDDTKKLKVFDNTTTVKFKKEHPEAKIPAYAHDTDSGMDLSSVESFQIPPLSGRLISTGFSIALPKGHEAQIRSRSGLAAKNGVSVLNSPGTIDFSYRGIVKIILFNHSQETFTVNVGDRIAQMVIAPVTHVDCVVVSELDETERGSGGFGSTGK